MVVAGLIVVAFVIVGRGELMVAEEEPSFVVQSKVAIGIAVVKVGVLRLVEPIALVVGRQPMLVELVLAEEELVPVELAFASSQLGVEKAVELEVQLLEQELESGLGQVAIQELVHLRLEVGHHPKPEEYYHQQPFSILDDLSCNDQDI